MSERTNQNHEQAGQANPKQLYAVSGARRVTCSPRTTCGTLVPQDPSDKPASELCKRTQAAKPAAKKKPAKRKAKAK
ncbi:similar to HsdS polypeptide, part of CfrA family-putative a hypothetical protein containing a conserved domain [Rhodopirellula baltica SH 1]|uniref:Uncharacterized protein n=1 Tax=Rhodopirellula baltica (strain DSM 10527 / NCIMB 13988 / SH1) TaxID=243090 RepID=Q7ULQ4_RHOBA|nr:similar to HsdS polypeptide, part of CfrA family-putative a hypothetical protein containing a conserved domain [Rhodopirellula baltica SH 1]